MSFFFIGFVILVVGTLIVLPFIPFILGLVITKEYQVGIVVRKFGPPLSPGKLVSWDNEAGYQADTLAPG